MNRPRAGFIPRPSGVFLFPMISIELPFGRIIFDIIHDAPIIINITRDVIVKSPLPYRHAGGLAYYIYLFGCANL
jgi:hypothetical protein